MFNLPTPVLGISNHLDPPFEESVFQGKKMKKLDFAKKNLNSIIILNQQERTDSRVSQNDLQSGQRHRQRQFHRLLVESHLQSHD